LAQNEPWTDDADERIEQILGDSFWGDRFKKLPKNQRTLDNFEERLQKLIRDDCYKCPFCFVAVAPLQFFRHFASHLQQRTKGSYPHYSLPRIKSFPKGGVSAY